MNEIQKLFSRSSEDLQTANDLLQIEHYRACISRAYYAMYYAAQALLLSEGLETSTHRGVIKLINLHFMSTGKISIDIGRLLKTTYDMRQSGDYDTDFVADMEGAEKAIANAKEFVDEVMGIVQGI